MVTDAIKAAKGKMNTMNNKAEIARNMPFSRLCVENIINTGTQIKLTDCAIRLAAWAEGNLFLTQRRKGAKCAKDDMLQVYKLHPVISTEGRDLLTLS